MRRIGGARAFRGIAVALIGVGLSSAPAPAVDFTPPLEDVPYFADRVADGTLPPVEQRAPRRPALIDFAARGQTPGRHGGDIRMLMSRAKDSRQLTVYGYARLVKYDRDLEIVPDILERVEVEGDRVFTLHLRRGHRWSDGHPFTTEDFRYFWEDMANNEDLYPVGPPIFLKVQGEYPEVTVIDETTVRYAWSNPNPDFLPSLARATPSYIYAPAHYLKQFHVDYAEPVALTAKVEASGQRSWGALHTKMGHLYRMDNPDLPVLQPWHPVTEQTASRLIFERNPYYHKIDLDGRQLPYADRIILDITESGLIPGKVATGDADLQGRYLGFDDYTLLKRNEERVGYKTHLWRIAKGAHLALFPNLTHGDPRYRALVRDPRFRRALSLATNRHEINRVIYYGLAIEGQNTLLPESPLYRPDYREKWTDFDLDRANALLDEMGLERRMIDGVRTYPNGDPVEIIVETAGSTTEETDVLQLIKDSWYEVGIRLYIKPLNLESMRRRIYAGETQMAISSGLENGIATADMTPDELAPAHQVQYQWSDWGQYVETNGNAGSPPDMEVGKRLMDLLHDWYAAEGKEARRRIWAEMLSIHADNLFTIGLVAGVLQPIVVRDGLMNVPETGIWNWDPGAHFGLYGLDGFYWAPDGPSGD
ncbi:ABC transporter substrate-binding protein [Marivibrio halodurans]|uniref:ABC transporter substrate-binding protein n=1 Tax=Marivibrio halodurans TaxID=2039722 RepID=A0A8J7SK10_9PROT|nr:ABC transporter substrate-binding protein [Marivibrio halodurans]MBP5858128.1 ABC transporter substrate-binding protein [Marivibrio halodurans]